VLIVNTCGFIGPAREESIEAILEAAEYKKTGRLRRLVVAGCLVQRYSGELRESLPEVDAFVGLDELPAIVERIGLEGRARKSETESRETGPSGAATYLYDHTTPRRLATEPWTAYVKIAEGCDHTCSFCAIPSFRGRFRSRAVDSVAAEVEALSRAGVREIQLIAQDSSDYGRDLGLRDGLPILLERLDRIEELRWIRVHYLYPNTITPRLIEAMARLERVVKYIDLPLQHAHAHTLRRMRRGGSADGHLDLLGRLRAAMPDAAVRTTFIVGFCGETEAEFEALMDFAREARFDHLGAFTYSHEEATPAEALEDNVPADVKEARRDRLMEMQQEIVREKNATRVGETFEVLVEGAHPETDHLLVGRMSTQAPDVDSRTLLCDGFAQPGTFALAEITDTAGYDLVGRLVDGR
jgi:ribosomal protein S12 methylthiotransferase